LNSLPAGPIKNLYRKERVFVLDSTHTPSLTLRDYSKVVCGYKQSLFNRKINFSPRCLEKMPGGSMPSLRTRWTVVCLAAAVSLLVPALLSAQGTGGRILGRVADPSGAVLARVKVTATNEATGLSFGAETNDSGEYSFPQVPVGVYTLNFELSGFKKDVRRGITLELNQVITLNMAMQLGQTQEVVDVTSDAPLVDTTSTQLGAVMDSHQVSNLPLNSRDTYQLLQLVP
jgi:hypothetical protein